MQHNLTHPTNLNTLTLPASCLTAASLTTMCVTIVNSRTSNGTLHHANMTFSTSTTFPPLPSHTKHTGVFHLQPHEQLPPPLKLSTSTPVTPARPATSPAFYNEADSSPAPYTFLTIPVSLRKARASPNNSNTTPANKPAFSTTPGTWPKTHTPGGPVQNLPTEEKSALSLYSNKTTEQCATATPSVGSSTLTTPS